MVRRNDSNRKNDSKRPAISEPKQILDVTSHSNNICIVYKKINQSKVMSGLTQYAERKIFVLVPK